jgi:hypothetical protein
MFQRILTLAMPLITAIIVNNIESIAEGIMTFYENNKGIFDGIGKAVSVLGKGFMMLVNFISGMEDNKDAKKMKELDSSITNLKGHLDKIKPLEELGKKLSTESTKAASKAPGGSGVKEDNKLTVSSETSSLMDAVISNDPEKLEKLSSKPENTSDDKVDNTSKVNVNQKPVKVTKLDSGGVLTSVGKREKPTQEGYDAMVNRLGKDHKKTQFYKKRLEAEGIKVDQHPRSVISNGKTIWSNQVKGKDNTLDMKGLVSKSNKRKTDTVIITNVVEKVVRV